MRCDAPDPESCAVWHRAPELGMHCTEEGRQWGGGTCPVCNRPRKLSMALKRGRFVYACHYEPSCTADGQEAIRKAVAALLPGCVASPRPKRRTIPADELAGLLGLDDCAMRLRLACLVWQVPPKDAADKLGMSRRTYYRAVTNTGRSRPGDRSGDS